MGNCHTVGPNEVLVISGGCGSAGSKRTLTGAFGCTPWCVSDYQMMSLEVMTLHPRCEKVETSEGVAVSVTGIAQVKMVTEKSIMKIASENFLGKTQKQIGAILLETFEGHLRAILGTMTVEEIFQDRKKFSQKVKEVAAPDVGKMGIEIVSFVIKEVDDHVDYLDSLGKTQVANVKKDANIGVNIAQREAGMAESKYEKERQDARFQADSNIANSTREYEMAKASYDQEVETAKAEAELAYTLQAAKEKQRIKNEEMEINVIERRKMIDIEEKEIERRERELQATVRSPAEAESYKVEVLAEAEKTRKVLAANADAIRIRVIGAAEATSIAAIGKAEAERMRSKAEAYKEYGDAALMSLILQCMPKLAAEIANPLGKTQEIVLINDGNQGTAGVSNEVNKLIGTLPPSVQALTGIDLSKFVTKHLGFSQAQK